MHSIKNAIDKFEDFDDANNFYDLFTKIMVQDPK